MHIASWSGGVGATWGRRTEYHFLHAASTKFERLFILSRTKDSFQKYGTFIEYNTITMVLSVLVISMLTEHTHLNMLHIAG